MWKGILCKCTSSRGITIPLFHEYAVPAAKRVDGDLSEIATSDLAHIFTCKKNLKINGDSVGIKL